MTDGPLLWFLNRATGLSLVAVLSLSVALGVLTLGGRAAGDGGARVPRFVTRSLHRNLALGSLALLTVHVATAIADEYVDIRWWQAVVPADGAYEPLGTSLGAVAFDLLLAVALTTALRHRIGHRTWRGVHVLSWAAWAGGVGHGLLVGSDLASPADWWSWSATPALGGTGLVLVALAYRLVARPKPVTSHPASTLPAPTGGVR